MKKLIIPASFSSLEKIRDYFSLAAQEAGLDEDAVFEVQVAVDEAASNIIDHAYKGECESKIECTYELLSDGLKLILHDHGKPFEPEKVELPDIVSNPSQRKQGGLGLYFMRQMMDEVNFSFNKDGGNNLTMFKQRKAKG
jgi:serine/threonine-protein kinase RsbW